MSSSASPQSQQLSGRSQAEVRPNKGRSTRDKILQLALKSASTKGLDGLTIGELAADAGLSKSGLFAHFRSKERLQLAVLEAAAADFSRQVFAPALKRARGEERLEAIFEHWLKWIRANTALRGCIFMAGAMEWDDREGPVRDALVGWFEQLYSALDRATRLAIDAGQFDPRLDVDAFTSALHAIAIKYHLDWRLMRSKKALPRARAAYQRLIESARAGGALTLK